MPTGLDSARLDNGGSNEETLWKNKLEQATVSPRLSSYGESQEMKDRKYSASRKPLQASLNLS